MKKIFYELLARLGFWIPCKRYLPDRRHWDWVLVSAKDRYGFRGLPQVGELRYGYPFTYPRESPRWHTVLTDEVGAYRDDFFKHYTVTHWHKLPRQIKDKKR